MEEVKALVAELKKIKADYVKVIEPKKKELYRLMDKSVQNMCPLKLGDEIKIDGRRAKVERIYAFSKDFFMNQLDSSMLIELDIENDLIQDKFSFTWAISGSYINKDNNISKWKFEDVSPIDYVFKDKIVDHKSLEDLLGIGQFIKID
jgi:hypothetical protein